MMEFIVTLIVTAISMIVASKIVPGIQINTTSAAFIGAFVFGIVNAVIKPILILFTLPATILTLGLFLFVINAICFYLVAYFTPNFTVNNLIDALLGSILVSIVSSILGQFLGKS
jgi:putative membrane protein